jgi:uncharacterized coiled-coil protein SlyX
MRNTTINGTLLMLQAGDYATNAAITASTAVAQAGVLSSEELTSVTTASATLVDKITDQINKLAQGADNDGNLTPENQTYISTAEITAGTVNSNTNSITGMLQNLIDTIKSFLSSQNDTLNNINQTMTNAMAPMTKTTQSLG